MNGMKKEASEETSVHPPPLEFLRVALECFAGADASLEKSASEKDTVRLYQLHEEVEKSYRSAVKAGKRNEADALLGKFSGWRYLKGMPGEAGDLHPLPAPEEK